ncbi:MAG: UDP-N-acetylmuramoyl-L-alanyl-D-glutamate--2,6-diaminopimelate ligase [Treponema sp.]|jgi:UDP-N-acetylmuramoyl-L-alanyl-D-glutamate--2,6-diaminopimelate ligase|nr:UDP-N-acetylmuramoyl-L-alanyl-D-glutamate--2,6-diaminopimelate ligase [Treponema sp.]
MEQLLSEFFTEEIARKTGFIEDHGRGRGDPSITGLEYDSRKIKPGNIYFALPGLHTDGHRFIPDAIKNGAAVIIHQDEISKYQQGVSYFRVKDSRFAMSPLSAAFYDNPSRKLILIGVTGTEGKSTTVYLIYQLLKLAGKKAGFLSTVQYSDGKTENWNPEHQTTPEATAIHRLLAEMVNNGAEYGVIETSSHGLSPRTNRLGDVVFDVAVMTNVTHEHLEFHGTWEQYRDDKANLFRSLDRFDHTKDTHPKKPAKKKPDKLSPPSFGVVNADDPSAGFFAAATRHKTYTYSTRGNSADLSLNLISSGVRGNWYEALIRETGEIVTIRDQLPGAFNAGNVLAGLLAVSGLLSTPIKNLVPLVTQFKPVRGRMTIIQKGQPFDVFVDYAHTPSSFEAIFPPLRERLNKPGGVRGGRIISLFGSAGERDTKKRSEQGRIAAQWSDLIFLTDEDPRGENPMDILEEIAQGCETYQGCEAYQGCKKWKRGKNLYLIPDRPKAIRKAFSLARPGDMVLLLGKGHENSIIYAEKTMAYDEITEAGKALAEMGWTGT